MQSPTIVSSLSTGRQHGGPVVGTAASEAAFAGRRRILEDLRRHVGLTIARKRHGNQVRGCRDAPDGATEWEPAESLADKSVVIGGRLSSLTCSQPARHWNPNKEKPW